MDSMWAEYMKEEYGRECLNNKHGFITYKIHDKECMIYDLYINPKSRNQGQGLILTDAVHNAAKANQCSTLTCLVDTSNTKGTGLCITYIKHGFKIIGANNNQIVMAKEL